MPRHPEGPRSRKDRESWVVMIDGRLHTLARGKANKPEARRRFLELLAERDRAAHERADPPVGLAIASYLADLRRRVDRGELSPSSRDDAIRRIADFPDRFGDLPVSGLSARIIHLLPRAAVSPG